MIIPFDLPHLSSPVSSAAEEQQVQQAARSFLSKVVAAFRRYHPGFDPSKAIKFTRQGRYWAYELPQVFNAYRDPINDPTENAIVLRAALDFLTDVDSIYLRFHPGTPLLYNSGIRYEHSPRTESWDSLPALHAKKFGDCKTLSAALIAEKRRLGQQANPSFRFVPHEAGQDYHILVMNSDGTYEDPSRKLGMGQDENAYFNRGG